MSRTRFEARMDKRHAVNTADAAGEIADSMAVRLELMKRVNSGEITLEAAQAELARIKRSAKAAGKLTRNQVFNRS